MGRIINEIGNTYGYLTVIERAENNSDSRAQWKCKCKCGNECIATGKSLRSGKKKSCGCLRTETLIKRNLEKGGDLTGLRFGNLLVLEQDGWINRENGHRDRLWKCQCDCGNICSIVHRYLTFGETISCGCVHSKGESEIKKWLDNNNYDYLKEYSFKNLFSEKGIPLRFDFALLNKDKQLVCLIEYQGDIHFKYRDTGWNTKEKFLERELRDKEKKTYCEKNNIPLYYITYKEKVSNRMEEITDECFRRRD